MARTPNKPRKARVVSETERAEWRAELRGEPLAPLGAAPVPQKKLPKKLSPVLAEPPFSTLLIEMDSGMSAPPAYAPPTQRTPARIRTPSLTNLDRRNAERFKRGERTIEARLDLHGMTRLQAQEALFVFIAAQVRRKRRSLLIITGKGARGAARGILQELVPKWLRLPELAEHILAFEPAQPKDGGSGALYVLLERKRMQT